MTPSSPQTPFEKQKAPKLVCEALFTLTPQQADESQPKGEIRAVATTFGPRETADGRKFFYTKEGFAQWADEMNNGGFADRPLPMFINHMSEALPVGEWRSIQMNDEQMEVLGQIYTNTTFGMDLMSILLRNPAMLPAVSISAYATQSRMVDVNGMEIDMGREDDGYFQITAGGLSEISVVMHPANPRAEIKSLEKFLNGSPNPRFIEHALREKGMSKSDAVKASALLKSMYIELRDEAAISMTKHEADKASELLESNQTAILAALNEKMLVDRLSNWRK